jgi:hypothetical protein
MLGRLIGLLALAAPAAIVGAMQGCSDEPPHQDICNWLADANNCYARFADDVSTQCGYPHVAGSDPLASGTGNFSDREDLAQCIKSSTFGGGVINFDPPLDPTMFPVTSVSVTIIDRKGTECGKVTASGSQTFGVTITPVFASDAGVTTNPDGGPLSDDITGGSVAFSRPGGRQRLDVSCAGGLETYNFNLHAPVDKCSEYAGFMPTAIIDSHPGLPEGAAGPGQPAVPGFVRLRIHYPPIDPNAEGAQPRVVEYFNCVIPAPPPPCQDMMRNGTETDIDCGGDCPGKCAEGQGCNVNEDCLSNNCGFNMGLQQCIP